MTKLTVTVLGTGTPIPVPGRAGSGTLIEAGPDLIQVDAGRGTVLRLAEAGKQASELTALLLTHHHSDHVIGLPDILISRWIMKNPAPLKVVAPEGPLTKFGEQVLDVWEADLDIRQRHTGRDPLPHPAWEAFEAGRTPIVVFTTEHSTVTSVLVRHEPVEAAVAYRIDTVDGKSVVVSGDTRVCSEVRDLSMGADVLVHEVVKTSLLGPGREYVGQYHAEAEDLGRMAAESGVGTLVLTHLEPAPTSPEMEAAFAEDVRRGGFTGDLIVARDLDRVEV